MTTPRNYHEFPKPDTESANHPEYTGELSIQNIAKLVRPKGASLEQPVSTVARVAHRVFNRRTGKMQSADEMVSSEALAAETAARIAAIVEVQDLFSDGSGVVDDESWRNAIRGQSSYRVSLPNTFARLNQLKGTSRPFHLKQLVLGDSFGVNLQEGMNNIVARNSGRGGLVNSNTSLFGGVGAITFDLGGGVFFPFRVNNFSYSPTGGYIPLTASGHNTIFGENVGTEGFNARKAVIFYSAVAGGGSFSVQQRIGSGAWTDLTTGQATVAAPISTNNGGVRGVGVLSIDWNATANGLRMLRINYHSGGEVAIVGGYYTSAWDNIATQAGGTEVFDMALSGSNVNSTSSTPENIFTDIISEVRPHFATWKADDNADQINASLETLMNKVESGGKLAGQEFNIDWILVSKHPTGADPTNELSIHDIALRDIANRRGVLFADIRGSMPPYAQYLSPIRFNNTVNGQADDLHLGQVGTRYQEQLIMNMVSDVLRPSYMTLANVTGGTTTASSLTAPAYWNRLGVLLEGSADQDFFDVRTNSNTGFNYLTRYLGRSYANGAVGFGFGSNNYIRDIQRGTGRMFFAGTAGAGFPNNLVVNRIPIAAIQGETRNQSTTTAVAAITEAGHTGNAFEARINATDTSSGVTSMYIRSAGNADFTFTALDEFPVSGLPTVDLKRGTKCFADDSTVPHEGNSGKIVVGGGGNYVPVYYDGTNWRIGG